MQNGVHCFCGDSYGNMGGKVPDSQCKKICPKGRADKCGGAYRNSIYRTNYIGKCNSHTGTLLIYNGENNNYIEESSN